MKLLRTTFSHDLNNLWHFCLGFIITYQFLKFEDEVQIAPGCVLIAWGWAKDVLIGPWLYISRKESFRLIRSIILLDDFYYFFFFFFFFLRKCTKYLQGYLHGVRLWVLARGQGLRCLHGERLWLFAWGNASVLTRDKACVLSQGNAYRCLYGARL